MAGFCGYPIHGNLPFFCPDMGDKGNMVDRGNVKRTPGYKKEIIGINVNIYKIWKNMVYKYGHLCYSKSTRPAETGERTVTEGSWDGGL